MKYHQISRSEPRELRFMKLMCAALMAVALMAFPCYGNLIHYYPFTIDATDVVGGANGTLLNGASVSGGNLLLDGVDDFVQIGQKIVPTSGSYSVALFARQTTAQSNFIELISQGFSGGPGFYIGHDPSGFIRVSDSWNSLIEPFPSDGQFHHFAVTVDADTDNSRLYVDGVLTDTFGSTIATTSGGTDTRFGRQFNPFLEFFGGALDEVRIYDASLTAGEVAQLTAVPEPSTLVLLVIALLGTGGYGCWRKRRVHR